MKRQMVSFLGVFGLLLVAASANAQTLHVSANVPFNFVVDKTSMPTGAYDITSINADHGSKVLAIQSGGKITKLVSSTSAEQLKAAEKTVLRFHRYGSEYFLSQIWVQGDRSGRQLRMSRREAEIAKNLQKPEDVIVLAALR